MTDESHSGPGHIPKRFRDLTADVRLERLVRYVVRQLSEGRHFDDVLQDSYVVAHSTEATRAELLEHPEIIKAMEVGLHRQFADYEETTGRSEANTEPDG